MLFVAESPLQLICSLNLKPNPKCVYIRAKGHKATKLQMQNICELKNLNYRVIDYFYEEILLFFMIVFNRQPVVLGSYFSGYLRLIKLFHMNYKVVDDGIASYKYLKIRIKEAEKKKIFTIYEDLSNELGLNFNNIRNLDLKAFKAKSNVPLSVCIVGQDSVEANIISKDNYILFVKTICQKYNNKKIIYFPHRKENKEKLDYLKNLNIHNFQIIDDINLPIELNISKYSISEIVSSFSSAIYVIKMLHPDIKIVLSENKKNTLCDHMKESMKRHKREVDEVIVF